MIGSLHSKRVAPLVAALAVLASAAAVHGQDAALEVKAVRQVLDAQAAAWNKGDLAGFMAGYWKSDELSFISGKTKTRGWQATYERYKKLYQAEGREMGKLTFSDIEIELIGADHAVVKGRWQLEMKKANPGGLFTLIFKKLPEGWRIIHDHTSS